MGFLPENAAQWVLVPVLLVIIVVGFMVGMGDDGKWTLEAQTRSRVARVKIDMKGMDEKLVVWSAQHHKDYPGKPYWGTLSTTMSLDLGMNPNLGVDSFYAKSPDRSLNPNSHVYSYHTPSSRDTSRLQYYSNGVDFRALISHGPDGVLDLTSETLGKAARLDSPVERQVLLSPFCYDPTNGTISNGDILRLGGKSIPADGF